MMAETYEVHLREADAPPGEIMLVDLTAIAGKLQELSTRVSRWVADIDGAGRGNKAVEDAAALRLTGITEGSTVLGVRAGVHGGLDFETPFERDVRNRFWDVVAGLGVDSPPDDAPVLVRESAVGLLDALGHAAPAVVFRRRDGAVVEFRPAQRDREVWKVAAHTVAHEDVTVVGVLEMIDLRAGRFRIADDVGNRIVLDDVPHAEEASRELVGKRVAASGPPMYDARGLLTRVSAPTLAPAEVPAGWRVTREPWTLPTHSTGPDPDGGAEFEDADWDDFLAAVKGA